MYTQAAIEKAIGKPMVFSKVFESTGETFSAITNAEKWASEKGLTIGSMQREAPMGLAKNAEYVSKWYNLGPDVKRLDGAIVGEDKREGSVTIFLSFNPEI